MLSSTKQFPFDLNPYESFMRRHLQHYGYFTDRSAKSQIFRDMNIYSESDSSDSEGDDTDVSANSISHDIASDGRSLEERSQEELVRTTQLVYTLQAGRMVLQLREPRQLYGLYSGVWGPQQLARWPAGIQIATDRIRHIMWQPAQGEPFYKSTGQEEAPIAISHRGHGRIVYDYEPTLGSYFVQGNVNRNLPSRIDEASVELLSDSDNTLIFESRFESGNLAKAVQVGPFEYELWLRTDLYTSKHTQWYYFMVSNTRTDVMYRFTLVNHMKPDSLYNNGMRPLMYSEWLADSQNIGWLRTGSDIKYYKNNITYTAGRSEKPYYSLTWTCTFPRNNDIVYFAHCYPYTYTDLQNYIYDIINDPVKSRYCRQRLLCRTLAGNLIYLLTITSPPTSDSSDELRHRKAVVLSSRVHPGETNASWMMKGFLDFLLSGSKESKLLCDNFVFKIIPMLNPDGVIVGNYRCSLTGHDLNRNYKITLKESFPSIWHTKNMIKRLMEEREVAMYCDLHGHSRRQNIFIYGCENRSDPQRRLREQIFPFMLSRHAPELFNFDYCKFRVQRNKEGTGRVVMWNMGIQNSYTLEATFCGSLHGKKKGLHFTAADFESMGHYFCYTLLDYCDPDNTRSDGVLSCLEERLKSAIFHRLRQQSSSGDLSVVPQDLADIDLNKQYLCDLDSSDGGSDSSDSEGLPVQVQFVSKLRKKKKRLKTKKERDMSNHLPGALKGQKDAKRQTGGALGLQVRQCVLKETQEHHPQHHHHQQQRQEQLMDKKQLTEPRTQKASQLIAPSVLRTATVVDVASNAMLQPRKSLPQYHPRSLKYTASTLDVELRGFLQERLEDGNARKDKQDHYDLRKSPPFSTSNLGSPHCQHLIASSCIHDESISRESGDIRRKSIDSRAALTKPNTSKVVSSEDKAGQVVEDRNKGRTMSPSYVTVIPFPQPHGVLNPATQSAGLDGNPPPTSPTSPQQSNTDEAQKRSLIPTDHTQSLAAVHHTQPHANENPPVTEVTQVDKKSTQESNAENAMSKDSDSTRQSLANSSTGSQYHSSKLVKKYGLVEDIRVSSNQEPNERLKKHGSQPILLSASQTEPVGFPTTKSDLEWLVEGACAEVSRPLTARKGGVTNRRFVKALLKRERSESSLLRAPMPLVRQAVESSFTVHVQPLKRSQVPSHAVHSRPAAATQGGVAGVIFK